jgi:hypothetical protein
MKPVLEVTGVIALPIMPVPAGSTSLLGAMPRRSFSALMAAMQLCAKRAAASFSRYRGCLRSTGKASTSTNAATAHSAMSARALRETVGGRQ